MKFIASNLSINMFPKGNFQLMFDELNKEEFYAMSLCPMQLYAS